MPRECGRREARPRVARLVKQGCCIPQINHGMGMPVCNDLYVCDMIPGIACGGNLNALKASCSLEGQLGSIEENVAAG